MKKSNFLKAGLRGLTYAAAIASSLFAANAKEATQQNTDSKLFNAKNLCMPGTLTLHVYDEARNSYQHTSAVLFFIIPVVPAKEEIVHTAHRFAYQTCVLPNFISREKSKWPGSVRHVDLAVFPSDILKTDKDLTQAEITSSIQQLLNGEYFAPGNKPVHAVSVTFLGPKDSGETSYLTAPYIVVNKNGEQVTRIDATPPESIVPENARTKIAGLIRTHLVELNEQQAKGLRQYIDAAYEFHAANVINAPSIGSVPQANQAPYVLSDAQMLALSTLPLPAAPASQPQPAAPVHATAGWLTSPALAAEPPTPKPAAKPATPKRTVGGWLTTPPLASSSFKPY